jgi:hypothetical protein
MVDDDLLRSTVWRKAISLINLSGDRAIIGGGVAAAFCSLAFATYMISDRDRQPYFFGSQYLAIFAMPSHGVQVAAHPSPVLARLDAPSDSNGVDPTPTGSIPVEARPEPPDGAGLLPVRYRLVAANGDAAWVESELGFRQVKPGDTLAGLGRIASIEKRNGRWALITSTGSTLELRDAPFSSRDNEAGKDRFARPLIFGRQPQ